MCVCSCRCVHPFEFIRWWNSISVRRMGEIWMFVLMLLMMFGPFSFSHFNLPSVLFGTFMAEHECKCPACLCVCTLCGIRDLYTLIQCKFSEMASNANVEVCSCHFDAYDVWKVANRPKFRTMWISNLFSSYALDWLLAGVVRTLMQKPDGFRKWLASKISIRWRY